MNFVDDIIKGMEINPKDWRATSKESIKNEVGKIEICHLGNGKYTGWFKYCHSIARLSVDGKSIKLTNKEKTKLEYAYVKWLDQVRLCDLV